MRATSDVGREAGREYVLYHVNFEHISDLSDDDLRFSYGKVDDGKSYQLRLTPMLRNPLIPPIGFHLEVKMPGEVIQSNASSVTDDVAVWDGTLNEFSRRGALYAKAEVWFLPPVVLAGLGIALLVIVGGVVWLMRTKRQRAGHQIRTGTIGQATDLRQCPHCQEFVSINVRFCKHCGASLSRGQIVG